MKRAAAAQSVHVVDGQLFHGDLTNIFLMNMSPEAIAQNVQALDEVIRPLRPLDVTGGEARAPAFDFEEIASCVRLSGGSLIYFQTPMK